MVYLYILQSEIDKGYYVGISKNVQSRLECHNKGRVRSTKYRKPFKVIYTEQYDTLVQARDREKHLKSYKGSKEKLTILKNL